MKRRPSEKKSGNEDSRNDLLDDLFIAPGAVAVSIGACLAYPPAGWVVAGVFLIVFGLSRGGAK